MDSIDLPTHLLSFFSGGRLKITCDDTESINFISKNDSMIVDILDIPVKISGKPGLIKQLSEAKDLAKKLKQQKITLEIRYLGDPVLKLGEKANPKLAKIITLSSDIEITDLKKLKKLSEVF